MKKLIIILSLFLPYISFGQIKNIKQALQDADCPVRESMTYIRCVGGWYNTARSEGRDPGAQFPRFFIYPIEEGINASFSSKRCAGYKTNLAKKLAKFSYSPRTKCIYLVNHKLFWLSRD